MISAFGEHALRYAPGLGDLEAVVADPAAVGAGFREAVRRRETGRPFYTMLLLDDPRVIFGYRNAEPMLAQFPDYDERRMLMHQFASGKLPINGVPAENLWSLEPILTMVTTEFLSLGDAVLVRSFAEAELLNGIFARDVPRRRLPSLVRVLAASSVPQVERRRPERPGVVVWAPHRPALDTALHLFGLAEFHGDLTCVSAGGPRPAHSRARFLEPGAPEIEAALAGATVVVCVEPNDPADPVAFARQGYGVVAPATSGAHEFASDVLAWDALDAKILHTMVAVAMTRPAQVRSEPVRPPRAPRPPERPAFVPFAGLPLVSIITPTYKRPEMLREMLACLAAQTYPNIESVVVNDGGPSLAEVVAPFPFVRLIEVEQNAGALRAVERGRKEARGEYIGLLPDDDWLYPDHVERMVNAMLRSGAKIAHGGAILRFLEPDEQGTQQTAGFNNRTFSVTHTPSEALVISAMGGQQMLVHRDAYATVGGYLLDSDVSDNEIHIRFTERYFYAFVDRPTSEFRDHSGGQGRRCDFPAALRDVYEHLHPVPDRPEIRARREATIANIASRPNGKPPFPMTIRSRPERT